MKPESQLVIPDGAILGPNGLPIMSSSPEVVGLNVFEAPGGEDSVSAIATIDLLRKRRERAATLVIAPGAITEGLLIEVAYFNQEAYQARELDESDKRAIAAAVRKKLRRAQKLADRA